MLMVYAGLRSGAAFVHHRLPHSWHRSDGMGVYRRQRILGTTVVVPGATAYRADPA